MKISERVIWLLILGLFCLAGPALANQAAGEAGFSLAYCVIVASTLFTPIGLNYLLSKYNN
jgi:hypothetical protein